MIRFRALPVLVSLFAMVSAAFAANPELSSAGLEQRVDFWKKVFTQYGENDLIIHDRLPRESDLRCGHRR